MKSLIYQYYSSRNTSLPPFARYSTQSISAYAYKHGHDYALLKQKVPIHPHYGIFSPFWNSLCNAYDYLCFIDCDVLATSHASDILKTCIGNALSIVQYAIDRRCNSGVVVFHKSVYSDLKLFLKDIKNHHNTEPLVEQFNFAKTDQKVINLFMSHIGTYSILDQKWNYPMFSARRIGIHNTIKFQDNRFKANLIHYMGSRKSMVASDFKNGQILK